MDTAALQDLAARVTKVAQALASGASASAEELEDLLVSQVDRTAGQLLATAQGIEDRAKQRLAELETARDAAVEEGRARLTETTARIEAERTRALASAQRAKAAALTAFEQAEATGDQALAEAKRTRDAASEAAEQAENDANDAAEAALREATDLAEAAKAEALKLVEAADQAAQTAEAASGEIEAAIGRGEDLVGQAANAAGQLPEHVVALGEDALARLEGALSWPSGLLSLVAQALVWLKKTHFAEVPELQVIWQQKHPPDEAGLGLLWQSGDQAVRLVYRPAPEIGPGSLLVETSGADSVVFTGGDITVTVAAKAGQVLVIGKGAVPPAGGPDAATLEVRFGGDDFTQVLGPLEAVLAMPTLKVDLRHGTAWGYTVTLDLPKYGAEVGLSGLLAQAGIPLPIAVPSIDETRSLTLSMSDGRFSVREGATA